MKRDKVFIAILVYNAVVAVGIIVFMAVMILEDKEGYAIMAFLMFPILLRDIRIKSHDTADKE